MQNAYAFFKILFFFLQGAVSVRPGGGPGLRADVLSSESVALVRSARLPEGAALGAAHSADGHDDLGLLHNRAQL